MRKPACPDDLLIMFCRPGLIRDVRVIVVQGGTSLHGGLGISAQRGVPTGRMNASVFRGQLPLGLQSYWRDSGGRRRTATQVKHPGIVCNLQTRCLLSAVAHGSRMDEWILTAFGKFA